MHKALLVWVCCTSFLFGQNTKEGQRVPLVGDETPLIKIKTDPHKYISDVRHHLELPIVMTGGIRLDNYYNYGYRDKQLVYYSYDFREFVTPTKLGDVLEGTAHLYLPRDVGNEITEGIIKRTTEIESDSQVGTGYRIARVKVILKLDNFTDTDDLSHAWNMFELLDIQFLNHDKWGPWLIQEQRKTEEAAAEVAKKAAQQKADEAKRETAKEAERQRQARIRTWHDKTGHFSVTAEYHGIAQGNVLLLKADGKQLKVAIESLSEADHKWLDDRRKGKPVK